MRIAIYGRRFGREFTGIARKLLDRLNLKNIPVSIYEPFYNFMRNEAGLDPQPENLFNSHKDLDKKNNYVLTIGGDGTILEVIAIVRNSGIPVLGINSGRLGFLANISRENTDMAVDALLSGRFCIEKRGLLKLNSPEETFGDFDFALNEFTLQKKDSAMITIQAWLNDIFINSYWADGLIISTPTGSTAYSLSVGGALLTPDMKGMIISPISPHNLTVRPLVIPENNTVRLKVTSRNGKFLLSKDHQSVLMSTEAEIVLNRSDFDISMVKFDHQDFYTTIREKLMWGADKRN